MRKLAAYMLVGLAGLIVSSLIPSPSGAGAAGGTGLRMLGAARGYAATALWLRAGDAFERGDLFETTATYQWIRELQPRNPAVYSYLAWNEAYNIAALFPDRQRREEWIERGFATLHHGQRMLPQDAGLRLDEWHFVLSRYTGNPEAVLRAQLKHWREHDQSWALVAEAVLEAAARLPEPGRRELNQFLAETGLQPGVMDLVMAAGELEPARLEAILQGAPDPDFEDFELRQLRALLGLSAELREILRLAQWCRYHLMTLVLRPAQDLPYRSLAVDGALLNSLRLAQRHLPGDFAPQFTPAYRQAVATAFAKGIENAARYGGDSAKAEFIAHMRENFADLPGWLP